MGVWDPLSGSIGAAGGGGASLGTARGAIIISTEGVSRAAVEVRRVSGDVERSFEKIGQSADRNAREAGRSFQGLSGTLRSLRGELLGVSLVAGGFLKFGIDAATSLRGMRIQFREMLGDEQKATVVMGQLREQADKYGLSMQDVNATAAALLPSLQGNTAELDKWVSRAARLSTKGPFAGTEKASRDATRAIAEFIAGQEISLQRLFNITPNVIAQAKAESGGDVGRALDLILEKVGATERGAMDMGNSFQGAMNRARNAAIEALDAGFTPILDEFLTPAVEKATEFLSVLQRTNPELLTMGAGLTTITAVGAPVLLFLGQMVQTLGALARLGIAGGLGLSVGAGAIAGTAAGFQGVRAIGRATGDERLQNADMSDFFKALNNMAFQIEHFNLKLNNVLGAFIAAIGQAVQAIATTIRPLIGEAQAKALLDAGKAAESFGKNLQTGEEAYRRWLEEALNRRSNTNLMIDRAFGKDVEMEDFASRHPATTGGDGGLPFNLSQEEVDAWMQYQEDLAQIAEDAQQERLEEEQRYEEQRTKTIEEYGRDRQKVVEDAELRIARATEDTARQIAEVRASAAEREAEEAQDTQERIAELQTDYQQDEIRRVEDFQRAERRAKVQHLLTLLSAAARLDARAVAEENRRFGESRDQKREDFDIETQRRAEELQERLQQEQQAHAERIQEARRADQRRIQDLQNALARETRLIAEDTQRRLQLMAEAHQRELQELYNQHLRRVQQIDQQEAELRTRRQQAFDNEIIQLDGHWGNRLRLQDAYTDAELELLRNYLEARAQMTAQANLPDSGGTGGNGPAPPPPRVRLQHGGEVDYTGPAMVHGSPSRPEYMLSPDTTAMLNRMLGGSFSQPQLVNAVAGGGGGRTINASISLAINGSTSMGPQETYRIARRALLDALNEVAGAA
jgi:hypothetical protein